MTKKYVDRPPPWTSKSKIKSLDYCPYSFYDERILGNKQENRDVAIEGTNMHMVFASFFEAIKPKHLFSRKDFTDPRIKIDRHPFRKFIYNASMNFVKPTQRSYGKYKNIINNFATIECERWLRINTYLHNETEIYKVFKPYKIEERLDYEPLHLFGTIDKINIEIMPGGTKKLAIYDYKTGNIPSSVLNHILTDNMFDWKLPPHYMKEIHFYALLYLLYIGWSVSDKITNFLENKDWWFVKKDGMSYKETLKYKKQYLTSLQKDYRMFKPGRVLKPDDIIVGFYFLKGDKGYRPIKKFTYQSYKSALLGINNYRSVMYNKYFAKHPRDVFDYVVCEKKRCSRFEECKEIIERDK